MLATEGVGAEGNTSWNTTEGTSGVSVESTAGTAICPNVGHPSGGADATATGCGPDTGDSGFTGGKTAGMLLIVHVLPCSSFFL